VQISLSHGYIGFVVVTSLSLHQRQVTPYNPTTGVQQLIAQAPSDGLTSRRQSAIKPEKRMLISSSSLSFCMSLITGVSYVPATLQQSRKCNVHVVLKYWYLSRMYMLYWSTSVHCTLYSVERNGTSMEYYTTTVLRSTVRCTENFSCMTCINACNSVS
jgi:hypothetical protein